jgi:hypothetical protein
MIGKVLPASYMVTVTGSATASLVAPDLNVATVTIVSRPFPSDLAAAAAAEQLTRALVPPGAPVVEEVAVNPEFFPHLAAQRAQEPADPADDAEPPEALLARAAGGEQLVPVRVTTKFDALGDFVELRRVLTGPDFRVQAKVLIEPKAYLEEKALALAEQHPLAHRELQQVPVRLQ